MTTEIRHLFADLGLGYRYQMHIQEKPCMQTQWEKPSTQTSKCCTSDKALNVKPVLIQKPVTKCHLSSLFRSQDLYIHSVLETNWIIVYGDPKKTIQTQFIVFQTQKKLYCWSKSDLRQACETGWISLKKKKTFFFVNNHCKGIFTMCAGGVYSQHRLSETCTHDITVGPFQSQFATKLTQH